MKTALYLIRSRCNYSQAMAAKAIGVSRQMLGAWESGAKALPPARQEQLAALFGIEPELLTEYSLEQVEDFCDRPMFSHTVQGRQVFSFCPTSESRVYLEGPGKIRPEEQGTALMNHKHRLMEQLEESLRLTPGHQADQLPTLEAGISILAIITRLFALSAQSEPDVSLRLLSFFRKQLSLLEAALNGSAGQAEFTPEEQSQLRLFRAHWAQENRQAMARNQNAFQLAPDQPDTQAWLEQLINCYRQLRFDGGSRAELQWHLNQLMNGVYPNETD